MRNIAGLPRRDREALFRNTAGKIGVNIAIVEKDFWVSYVLDYLFSRSQWSSNIAFKGGTSLSKAFHLIERFSEDIDLILDWRVLGFAQEEPWETRSNTKQLQFNREANRRAAAFLRDVFLPAIRKEISHDMKEQAECRIDETDEQTVLFYYPTNREDSYIKPVIRLEIGPLAAWSPATWQDVSPFAAEYYPQIFQQKSTKVLAVEPKRTFWEKATILHQEANRAPEKGVPMRYSRHYYDFFQMLNSKVKVEAINDIELLKAVVEFKKRFYPCPWANYDMAANGKLKLSPKVEHAAMLQKDYDQMGNMIFGKTPSFEQILEALKNAEKEINKLNT